MASVFMYRGYVNASINSANFVIRCSGVATTKDTSGSIFIQEVNNTNIKQRHHLVKDTNT